MRKAESIDLYPRGAVRRWNMRFALAAVFAIGLLPAVAHAQGKLTRAPELVEFVEAPYPEGESARSATVILKLSVSAKGGVDDAVVVTSAGLAFDAAALDAVRRFTF